MSYEPRQNHKRYLGMTRTSLMPTRQWQTIRQEAIPDVIDDKEAKRRRRLMRHAQMAQPRKQGQVIGNMEDYPHEVPDISEEDDTITDVGVELVSTET